MDSRHFISTSSMGPCGCGFLCRFIPSSACLRLSGAAHSLPDDPTLVTSRLCESAYENKDTHSIPAAATFRPWYHRVPPTDNRIEVMHARGGLINNLQRFFRQLRRADNRQDRHPEVRREQRPRWYRRETRADSNCHSRQADSPDGRLSVNGSFVNHLALRVVKIAIRIVQW